VTGLASPAAVELFVDRARAVQPGFECVGQTQPIVDGICQRLDGLPLAIELAPRAFELYRLACSLSDLTTDSRCSRRCPHRAARQQTLRAVVDWSYDLLSENERRLFARLSIFVGGCEFDAIEAVCVDDMLPGSAIVDVLSRLCGQISRQRPNHWETRFTQLQTLLEYGTARLDDSNETNTLRARHAAFYRRFAENANSRLRGARAHEWSERLSQNWAI